MFKIFAKKNKFFLIFGVTILIFLFQQLASKAGEFVSNQFNYSVIDPDNTFMFVTVHHIVQALFALIIIFIFTKFYSSDFNLNFKNKKQGLKYTAIFTAVMLVYTLGSYIIGYNSSSISAYPFPLNAGNVLGTLGFQLFLSGPSEELLFRALPITIIASVCKIHHIKIGKINLSVEVLIAAFLFSIAHINWSISPFYITANAFQLVYAFALGIIYGITYQKTKSIIYPMAMHSISNVLMVGAGYIFAVI